MHREWNLPNPLTDDYHLSSVLRGVRRSIGDHCAQKLPITPDVMLQILTHLDMSSPFDVNVWAICLVLFHALLRKASVLPARATTGQDTNVLARADVTFTPMGMCLLIKHTKTIQFGERSLTIPIPRLRNNVLCPVQAVFKAFHMVPDIPRTAPAFCVSKASSFSPITGQQFDARLKACLLLTGRDPRRFSAHSFRRAGATCMYQAGLPAETIRAVGDWRSSCYLKYLTIDNSTIYDAIATMQKCFPK